MAIIGPTHWGHETYASGDIHASANLVIIGLGLSHKQNQYWLIVIWTSRNKLQLKLNKNTNIFFQENAFEKIICKMSTIFFQGSTY